MLAAKKLPTNITAVVVDGVHHLRRTYMIKMYTSFALRIILKPVRIFRKHFFSGSAQHVFVLVKKKERVLSLQMKKGFRSKSGHRGSLAIRDGAAVNGAKYMKQYVHFAREHTFHILHDMCSSINKLFLRLHNSKPEGSCQFIVNAFPSLRLYTLLTGVSGGSRGTR